MVFGSFGLEWRLGFLWFLLKDVESTCVQIGPFYRCGALLVEADHKSVELNICLSIYFGLKVSDSLNIWWSRLIFAADFGWSCPDTDSERHLEHREETTSLLSRSPRLWGRTRRKNRNKPVKWKRINDGDYSWERRESWRFTLKASSVVFHSLLLSLLSGWREGWRSVFSPMALALISKFFLPERRQSGSVSLHPSVSLHLFSSRL